MEILTKWENKIYAARDEYISRLPDPDKPYENLGTFNALIMFIYRRVFYPENWKLGLTRTTLNLDSVKDLYTIFYIFADLCTEYNHITSCNYLLFCCFIGITKDTFIEWQNGKASPEHGDFAKMVYSYSETMLNSNVSEKNSIGSMFLLKAKYSYVESSAPQQIQINTAAPTISKEDILSLTAGDPVDPGPV